MHEEADDLLEMCALGVLHEDQAARVARHLAAGCAECAAKLAALEATVGEIAYAVASVEPPPALRARLLERVASQRPPSRLRPVVDPEPPPMRMRAMSFAAAALLAAAAVAAIAFLTMSLLSTSSRLDEAVRELAATREANRRQEEELKRKDALLGAARDPQVRVTRLSAPGDRPEPAIDVLWQPGENRGVLVARNLPSVEPNRTYELWLIAGSAPVPAATFNTDEQGNAIVEIRELPSAATPQKFAVTVEPAGGSPAPTTDIILVGDYVGA